MVLSKMLYKRVHNRIRFEFNSYIAKPFKMLL